MNNIVIYKIGRNGCPPCNTFEMVKKDIERMCKYPIISIQHEDLDKLQGTDITVEGHTVTVPYMKDIVQTFPKILIYDKETLIGTLRFRVDKYNKLSTFITNMNNIIKEYIDNKLQIDDNE